MNEKSNPMPMMYKTIPAVAELNKVPGFDPLKFLRHKVSRKTNEEMLQLELPYQKLWFRLRHPQGRMKLTTLRITEQLAIMEARVYLEDVYKRQARSTLPSPTRCSSTSTTPPSRRTQHWHGKRVVTHSLRAATGRRARILKSRGN